MIDTPVLRWLLTLLFAATALWCARVMLLPAIRMTARVDAAWHVLMGAAMVAMAWPWGMGVPTTPQTVLFVLACAWFLGRTAFGAGHDHGGAHSARRVSGVHHAAMMAAMAWMVASMPSLMGGHGTDAGGGHHHALGGGGTSGMAAAAPMDMAAVPTALTVTNMALGVVFVVACLPWLARALDLGRRLPDPQSPTLGRLVADCGCHAAMSFGMGVMFLATNVG